MEKIDPEIAQSEFKRWAEAKKIPEKALEKHEDDAEAIVDAIREGSLLLEDDLSFTQNLKFPVKEGEINQLKYKFRISEGELAASTKGLRADELIGQMPICYISALTGQNRGIIRSLDPVDVSLGKHIAAFFLI
jgi:hypothetical protein